MKSITVTDSSQLGNATVWLRSMLDKGLPGGPVVVSVGREGRTVPQNDKLWPCLRDVSQQVDWYGQKLSEDDWKHVFTASLERQRVVPGLDGGFVMCGISTSKMSKRRFSDLLELIQAFGSEREVVWSEPSLQAFEQYREAAQ